MQTTIYLLRHAHTTPSPRYAPSFDWPLDAKGQDQAQALVPILGDLGIDVVCASPQLRAVETVAPFATHASLQVQDLEGLKECGFNRIWAVDFIALVQNHWADFDFAQPDCETHRSCQSRFLDTLVDVGRKHRGQSIVCCSGGQAIGLALNSIAPAYDFDDWKATRTPDLFKVQLDGNWLTWDRDFGSPKLESLLAD
jgi:2,3-bisphosphoglycerate-dependent phosphoglycerate mutase